MSLLSVAFGCAERGDNLHDTHRTTFGDHGAAAAAGEVSVGERGSVVAVNRAPLAQTVLAYQVPEKLQAKLSASFPELTVPQTNTFKVENISLEASAKTSRIEFKGVLKITNQADEKIDLACSFDPAVTPWSCDDLYPTDAKIAEQKRLQATATCDQLTYDAPSSRYQCKNMALELFVSINGKVESQLFQTQPFEIRLASAGDFEVQRKIKPDLPSTPAPTPTPAPAPATPVIEQKPTRSSGKFSLRVLPEEDGSPSQPSVVTPQPKVSAVAPAVIGSNDIIDDRVSDDEASSLLENSDVALETTSPVPTPAPKLGKYSIPGVEAVKPKRLTPVVAQAFGSHADGSLRDAAELPKAGRGYVCRFQDGRNYGTNFTIETLLRVAGDLDQSFPKRSPLVVANIAQKYGGHMCSAAGNCHASHQTGLDVDIVLPARKTVHEMWNLCQTVKVTRTVRFRSGQTGTVTSTVCAKGSAISKDLDDERAWAMLKDVTCKEGGVRNPVIAMFLDHEIKMHFCAYAKSQNEDLQNPNSCAFKTLQSIKHETGHFNHVHVRLRCPGNQQCRNSLVNLTNSTGC